VRTCNKTYLVGVLQIINGRTSQNVLLCRRPAFLSEVNHIAVNFLLFTFCM